MENLIQLLTICVCACADYVATFFASLFSENNLLFTGSGLTLAFALGVATLSTIPEGTLAAIRRWHGNIDDQFSAIDNVVNRFKDSPSTWSIPPGMQLKLTTDRDALQTLISKCRTTNGSTDDRAKRNLLLKTTVGYCLTLVKIWAQSDYLN
ncbi:MAG: hypothetical protein LBT78_08000, partial [Tannerella sp.]|nr:hypothetical protein [Tannerella sp.]